MAVTNIQTDRLPANITVSGNVMANNFVGNGAGLTSVSGGGIPTGNSGIISNSSGVFVNANTGLVANSLGLFATGNVVANVGAAGANTQFQYNLSGALSGAAGLTYLATGNNVTITGQNTAATPLTVKAYPGVTANLLQISTPPPSNTPVYVTGNRRASITVSAFSTSPPLLDGDPNSLVDGIVYGVAGETFFESQTAPVVNCWIQFSFSQPAIVTEAKWYQDVNVALGTWQWQSSNDAVTWGNIGATFVLGTGFTHVGNTYIQTITNLSGNIKAQNYYRLYGVSGNSVWDSFTPEIEFKQQYISDYYVLAVNSSGTLIGNGAGLTSLTTSPTIVSVKSFGATGDGITDDTAAIQAACNAAFQTAGIYHENQSWLNKQLYFPAGQYLISNVIHTGPIMGATIFGDGRFATKIMNNTSSNATYSQGVFATDAAGYCHFRDFTLQGVYGDANSTVFDFDWFTTGTNVGLTGCKFENIYFGWGGIGCGIGRSGLQGDTSTFLNCTFDFHRTAGVWSGNYNALGNSFVGCNFMGNYVGIYVAYGCITVLGCSFEQQVCPNTWNTTAADIQFSSSAHDATSIVGSSSESPVFIQGALRPLTIDGCEHRFTGANAWFYMPAPTNAPWAGSICIRGCYSANGGIYCHNQGAAYIIDGFTTGRSDWLYIPSGTANVQSVDIRNLQTGNASFWSTATKYSMLIDPVACSGQRGMISDANVTTWGSTVTVGGNSHIVPIWSDGTNWRVG